MSTDVREAELLALEQAVRREQALHAYPDRPWVTTHDVVADAGADVDADDAVLDVLVVGGGQAGITCAAKLLRDGVPRVLVVDSGRAGAEGPWVTWARMETLRTVKDLHGPDLGHPSATFRSWYEAQHGQDAWNRLGLIPREDWMAYLAWVRRIFAVPVLNETRVLRLTPDGGSVARWSVTTGDERGRTSVRRARRVLVCTGLDGVGGPTIPPVVADLPRHLWSHSSDDVDLPSLRGGRVAVLGVGASAFDNAAAALEAGAAEVVQFGRRAGLPTVNPARVLESRAMYRHYATLTDEHRLAITRRFLSLPMPPPEHSVERCRRHPGYELRLGRPWSAAREADDGGGVLLDSGEGEERFDHLVLGTGFGVDLSRVPWLADVTADLLLWSDVHPPEPGDAVGERLGRYPYLDAGMAALGRTAEADLVLRHLYLFNAAALASAGTASVGINALPWGSDQVTQAITRSLFEEEVPRVVEQLERLAEPQVVPPVEAARVG